MKLKEKWNSFKESLSDVTSISKKEFLLIITVCILGGIVFGIFCSPKKTVLIGSNNGNNSGNNNKGDVANNKELMKASEDEEQEEEK